MKKKSRFMAFWGYDLFPYYLWGEIDTKQEPKTWMGKMTYYIPSFQGYYAPEFVLPYDDGEILGNLLKELKRQKRLAEDRLNDEYKEHLTRILKENGVEK